MTRQWTDIAALRNSKSRSISAENPRGEKSGGARAKPGDDQHCSPASSEMGQGWKVRPCLKDIKPGEAVVIAEVQGPGVIQHIWCTVFSGLDKAYYRHVALRVYYDDQCDSNTPSVNVPIGDFFANGLNGAALIDSAMIAVNPKGGMNSYWPMPFRKRIRIEVQNDGPRTIPEFFYQITYALEDVPADTGYLHVSWRRAMTTRDTPELVIADSIKGRGHFAGTYLVWNQLSNHWWGEGEVKFFIDGDKPDAPTICGTGTEDYFGGAWGFVMEHDKDLRPHPYSTLYLGYPQAVYGHDTKKGPMIPSHTLYRWHIMDPVCFAQDLRVTVQALGWWVDTTKYQALTDDIAATAYWYQALPTAPGSVPDLPPLNDRLPR